MGEAKNATRCGEMKYMMFKIEARNSRGRARRVFLFSLWRNYNFTVHAIYSPRCAAHRKHCK